MKFLGTIFILILLLVVAVALAGQMGWFSGQVPVNLGIHNGRFSPPSSTPNSVSSQADLHPEHPQRAYATIAPLAVAGDADEAMRLLTTIVQGTPRCKLVVQQADYLYAQCSTALLRFTDDVEFWLDRAAGVIQVRSASRLGRSDLGVNRARVETIRAQFTKN